MTEKFEELNLPNAVITRIIKEAIPPGSIVSKECIYFRNLKLLKSRVLKSFSLEIRRPLSAVKILIIFPRPIRMKEFGLRSIKCEMK